MNAVLDVLESFSDGKSLKGVNSTSSRMSHAIEMRSAARACGGTGISRMMRFQAVTVACILIAASCLQVFAFHLTSSTLAFVQQKFSDLGVQNIHSE